MGDISSTDIINSILTEKKIVEIVAEISRYVTLFLFPMPHEHGHEDQTTIGYEVR